MPSASPDSATDRSPAVRSAAEHGAADVAAADVFAAATFLSRLPDRLDPTATRIIRHAIARAGGAEQLSVEHLFRALMAVDCGFVFRKLRSIRLPVHAALRHSTDGTDRQPGNLSAVFTVLQLADGLAAVGVRINTQHLLVAIFLEGSSCVAQQVRASGIDLRQLLIAKFACLPKLRAVADGVAGERPEQHQLALHPALGATLPRALNALALPPPLRTPPPAPCPRVGPHPLRTPPAPPWLRVEPRPVKHSAPPCAAEEKARRWLEKLMPTEAESYTRLGFVEISSGLFSQRSYRIYCSGRITDVFEHGRLAARRCLKLAASDLPPTDRVIAEYFLIRGDERAYLKTAIRSRC